MSHHDLKRYIFIIPVRNDKYVGFILTKNDKNEWLVYLNEISNSIDSLVTNFQNFYPQLIINFDNFPPKAVDWAKKIVSILDGIDQDTADIPLDLSDYTPKQAKVIEVAQKMVPVNKFYTYGQVAALANMPSAHRFVGTTMRVCRQPWIIPCHRIKNSQFIKRLQPKPQKKMRDTPV